MLLKSKTKIIKLLKKMEDEESTAQIDKSFSALLSYFTKEDSKEPVGGLKIIKQNKVIVSNWFNIDWTCLYCAKPFNCYLPFKSHLQSVHNIENAEEAYYQCNVCDEQPLGYACFLTHIRRIHYEKLRLCCDVCNKMLPNYGELSLHRNKHIETLNTSFPTVYNCTLCEKCCPNEKQLKSHLQGFHNPLYSMNIDDDNLQSSMNDENTRVSLFSDIIEEDSSSQPREESMHCGKFEKSFAREKDLSLYQDCFGTPQEKISHRRCINFTTKESLKLLRILSKYKKTIENKKIDAETKTAKQEVWKKVTEEFNKNTNHLRDVKTLRTRYKNMKIIARKKIVNKNSNSLTTALIETTKKNHIDEKASPSINNEIIDFESTVECDSPSVDLTAADTESNNIFSPIAIPNEVPKNTTVAMESPAFFENSTCSYHSQKRKIRKKNSITSRACHEFNEEKIKLIKDKSIQQLEQHEHILKYLKEEHELKMKLMKEEFDLKMVKLRLEINSLKNNTKESIN